MESLASGGLNRIFPEDPQERGWLMISLGAWYTGLVPPSAKDRHTGRDDGNASVHAAFGAGRAMVSYQGAADLRTYRATCDASYAAASEDEPVKFRLASKGSSQLRDGDNSACTPSDGDASSVEIKPPANFLPGGWFVDLLASLPDGADASPDRHGIRI